MGIVAGSAFAVLNGGMERSIPHQFVVTLIAEGASLLDETKFLGLAVVLVAGSAIAAVDWIMSVCCFGQLIMTIVAKRFLGTHCHSNADG